MKFNRDITYYCKECNSFSSILHEIIYGWGNRTLAIKYNIQVPLCQPCHAKAHRHKMEYMTKFLDWLELDYQKTLQAFNNPSDRKYLDDNADKCKRIIESLEV